MDKTISGVFAGLCAAALMSACGRVEGESKPPARPVRVEPARVMDGASRLRYSASLQPDLEVPAAFSVGGYVQAVSARRGVDGQLRPLQAGDAVRAGETLARLRESDYRERLHQAEGAIAELEAAQVKARVDLARAQTLFADESLTRPELDAAIATASANEARIASARAQRALAAIALGDGLLRAPVTGVILERRVDEGSLVQPGSAGFVIGRLSPIKAVFGVPDLHVGRLRPGDVLTMATEAFGGETFNGPITAIAPVADSQSRLYRIEVSLANDDGRLRPGMIGTVDVATRGAAGAAPDGKPAIPLAAVVRGEGAGGYAVFIAEGREDERIVRTRRVELGDVRGNHVLVTSGLTAGEAVIVSAPNLLVEGDRVRIVP
jgi:RND family efflux transporter MFP subunit